MAEKLKSRIEKLPSLPTVITLILLIAPFFRPQIIFHLDQTWLVTFYFVWRIVSAAFCLTLFLILFKKDAFVVLAFLFAMVTLASTLLFHGKPMVWFDHFFCFFVTIVLTFVAGKLRPKAFLYALFTVAITLLAVHVVTIMAFPSGIWKPETYFFGNRNSICIMMLTSLGSSFLLDTMDGARFSIRTGFSLFLSCFGLCLDLSTTSALALVALLVFYVLVQWKPPRRILNGFVYLGAYVAGFLMVVVFKVQEHLGWLLGEVFHKSTTLSGRGVIWDAIFAKHSLKFIPIGHGSSGYGYIKYEGSYLDAHNQFLHIWYVGGIIGIVMFAILLILAARNIYRYRTHKSAAVLGAILGAFFVIGITEANPFCAFYFFLTLAYCYNPYYFDVGKSVFEDDDKVDMEVVGLRGDTKIC